MLVKIPYYNISSIKAFALEGWTLGKTHGLPHWQRVERNGILLSLKEYNGSLYLRKDINIKVIRLFAYLHDKCRLSNHNDWKHGERAADMLYTIRNTLLKDLTNEEFYLLEKACRFHTTMHKTGNPTIDVCFDADRLDLGRVGIEPHSTKMVTERGKYYASFPNEFKRLAYTFECGRNF